MTKKRVILGMSGGVDSSLAGYLLKMSGYDVIGIFMKNWEEEGCPAESDFQDVAKVASHLNIPYYSVNFSKAYESEVFKRFLDDLKKGRTPNPDVFCNQEIKFKVFFQKALELGADYIATGHYANVRGSHLLRAHDIEKDQSYFLHRISGPVLSKTLFPLGRMTKKEVRSFAASLGLATAEKKDSTGICFIGKRNFQEFIGRYFEKNPGPIASLDGKILGEHTGLFNYTIGQRKGLCIGGEGAAWFVAKKDQEKNTLYVVQGEDHPLLYTDRIEASEESWLNEPPPLPYSCQAKIRYRSQDVACVIEKREKDRLHIRFHTPVKAATPGQSIVFYDGLICLGGAVIERPLHNSRG